MLNNNIELSKIKLSTRRDRQRGRQASKKTCPKRILNNIDHLQMKKNRNVAYKQIKFMTI